MENVLQPRKRRIPFEYFPSLHAPVVIVLSLALFWSTLSSRVELGTSDIAGCPWNFPPPSDINASQCTLKNSLERPSTYLCGFFASVLTMVFLFYKKNPKKLQGCTFFISFALVVVLQCLSSFSGFVTLQKFYWIPIGWGVFGRPLWIWYLAEGYFWNWTYLGVYEDFHFRKDSLDVVDKIGTTVWNLSPPSKDHVPYPPFSPQFLPWTDTAVRVTYMTLFDNIMFVLWLRYAYQHGPYTRYVSNSEILTILLFFSMILYTYARMRTHVVFSEDEEMGLEKQSTPFSRHTMTGELLGWTASCQEYRKISLERRLLLLFAIPCAAFIIITSSTFLFFLWALLLRGVVFYYDKKSYMKQGYSEKEAEELAMRDNYDCNRR